MSDGIEDLEKWLDSEITFSLNHWTGRSKDHFHPRRVRATALESVKEKIKQLSKKSPGTFIEAEETNINDPETSDERSQRKLAEWYLGQLRECQEELRQLKTPPSGRLPSNRRFISPDEWSRINSTIDAIIQETLQALPRHLFHLSFWNVDRVIHVAREAAKVEYLRKPTVPNFFAASTKIPENELDNIIQEAMVKCPKGIEDEYGEVLWKQGYCARAREEYIKKMENEQKI